MLSKHANFWPPAIDNMSCTRGPVKTKYGYHIFVITDEAKMVDTGKDGMDLPLGAGPGTL